MRSEPLSTLPGTYRELTVLERQFQGDGFYYAGRDASEKTFKVMANRADIIHLAVHGKASSEASPSGLFFPAAGDSLEDGELHLDEIYNLRLNADLVVLSACETGTGQFFAGEGTESIASAFAYAGGRNVLMSLWRVEDWSTGGLMNAFYRDQNSASSLVDALTSAKRAYLHEADALRAHPSLWAGFILVGDGEHARSAYRDRWWTTLAFALALSSLSVITWLWWRKRKKPLSLWSR
jgi:CHAT domain-containing protein